MSDLSYIFLNKHQKLVYKIDSASDKVTKFLSIVKLRVVDFLELEKEAERLNKEKETHLTKNVDADPDAAILTEKKWKSILTGYLWLPLVEAVLSYRAISFLLAHLVGITKPVLLLIFAIISGYAILFIGKTLMGLYIKENKDKNKKIELKILKYSSYAPAFIIPAFYWIAAYSMPSNVSFLITIVLSFISALIHVRLIGGYEKLLIAQAHKEAIKRTAKYNADINLNRKQQNSLRENIRNNYELNLRPAVYNLMKHHLNYKNANHDVKKHPNLKLSNNDLNFINTNIINHDLFPYLTNDEGKIVVTSPSDSYNDNEIYSSLLSITNPPNNRNSRMQISSTTEHKINNSNELNAHNFENSNNNLNVKTKPIHNFFHEPVVAKNNTETEPIRNFNLFEGEEGI